MILAFVDDWQQPATEHLRNVPGSSRKRYVVDVQAGTPLSICMAYTDEPARALQNDISLSVQLPSNLKMLGNENVPKPFVAPFDTFNNVECVRIDDPAAGNYLIQDAVQTLKSDSQDFALVVTGDLNSPLTEI